MVKKLIWIKKLFLLPLLILLDKKTRSIFVYLISGGPEIVAEALTKFGPVKES